MAVELPELHRQSGSLEVDLNFMFRQPLWDIHHADSHPLGDYQVRDVPLLDLHELAAGKLSALFSLRQQSSCQINSRLIRFIGQRNP